MLYFCSRFFPFAQPANVFGSAEFLLSKVGHFASPSLSSSGTDRIWLWLVKNRFGAACYASCSQFIHGEMVGAWQLGQLQFVQVSIQEIVHGLPPCVPGFGLCKLRTVPTLMKIATVNYSRNYRFLNDADNPAPESLTCMGRIQCRRSAKARTETNYKDFRICRNEPTGKVRAVLVDSGYSLPVCAALLA